jgi:hypothetical protein
VVDKKHLDHQNNPNLHYFFGCRGNVRSLFHQSLLHRVVDSQSRLHRHHHRKKTGKRRSLKAERIEI